MKMNTKGNDYYETPMLLYQQLDRIFKFNLDVACNEHNAKCNNAITEKKDALSQDWCGRCFCNPPFSKKSEFIKKAHGEVLSGNCPICVMILPLNSMDTQAWHEYIEGKFHYEILQGRVSFINPETGKPQSGNNSGTVIVYFNQKIQVKGIINNAN